MNETNRYLDSVTLIESKHIVNINIYRIHEIFISIRIHTLPTKFLLTMNN